MTARVLAPVSVGVRRDFGRRASFGASPDRRRRRSSAASRGCSSRSRLFDNSCRAAETRVSPGRGCDAATVAHAIGTCCAPTDAPSAGGGGSGAVRTGASRRAGASRSVGSLCKLAVSTVPLALRSACRSIAAVSYR